MDNVPGMTTDPAEGQSRIEEEGAASAPHRTNEDGPQGSNLNTNEYGYGQLVSANTFESKTKPNNEEETAAPRQRFTRESLVESIRRNKQRLASLRADRASRAGTSANPPSLESTQKRTASANHEAPSPELQAYIDGVGDGMHADMSERDADIAQLRVQLNNERARATKAEIINARLLQEIAHLSAQLHEQSALPCPAPRSSRHHNHEDSDSRYRSRSPQSRRQREEGGGWSGP